MPAVGREDGGKARQGPLPPRPRQRDRTLSRSGAAHRRAVVTLAPALYVFGCGTFAVQVLEIAELAGGLTPVGFINSFAVPSPGATLENLPVHHIDNLPHGPSEAFVI